METNTDRYEDEMAYDDFPDGYWYCNHDVPNGCHGCARLRAENEMLEAMTPDERTAYFDAQDERELRERILDHEFEF